MLPPAAAQVGCCRRFPKRSPAAAAANLWHRLATNLWQITPHCRAINARQHVNHGPGSSTCLRRLDSCIPGPGGSPSGGFADRGAEPPRGAAASIRGGCKTATARRRQPGNLRLRPAVEAATHRELAGKGKGKALPLGCISISPRVLGLGAPLPSGRLSSSPRAPGLGAALGLNIAPHSLWNGSVSAKLPAPLALI
jgi:hypothetical protein